MPNVVAPVMHRRRKQPDPEEQVEPDRGAEELREVGRHRDRLRLDPEPDRGATRELLAADLREVASRRDPELRGERLDQHRHQVRCDDHPHERVAELRPAGDVRGEVAGVDVRDARDERRAQKRQETEAPIAAQDGFAGPYDGTQLVYASRNHGKLD